MGRIKNIRDVVEWGLCTGCGACASICDRQAIRLQNIADVGLRPLVEPAACGLDCACLAVCPGLAVDGYLATGRPRADDPTDTAFGPVLEIWEGHAADPEIRKAASSGGALTALALYCLEQRDMAFAVHTGMQTDKPYLNETVRSTTRAELLQRTGSRYAPASPGEGLGWIAASDRPCVFIGKPCDASAAAAVRQRRPGMAQKLGVILTFFCAGTPSTRGTLDFLSRISGIAPEETVSLRYRGNGWPGQFTVRTGESGREIRATYEKSWRFLQKYRPFRCHLCPDGLGQVADIACGDGWHEYAGPGNSGWSLILIRTARGRDIFHGALAAGYLTAQPAGVDAVLRAQPNLLQRRKLIFGRLLAMKLLLIPVPHFRGFSLFRAWTGAPFAAKMRSVLGTLRRLLQRRLYQRKKVHPES